MTVLACLSACSLAIWIYLILWRGGFWIVSKNLKDAPVLEEVRSRVAVVIPARNEADVIAVTVRALLSQRYPYPLHVVVVDDASTDETQAVVRQAVTEQFGPHTLSIIDGKPLAPGWTGKLWALDQGVEQALRYNPDFLLFTDADIEHSPDTISRLVGIAEAEGWDMASYMVRLACGSFAEKALIPAFVFFFLQLYPPAWIKSPHSSTAGAAGGCILVRPEILKKLGGLAEIRDAVIDDCTLARAVKRHGGRVWMGLTAQSTSTRSYGSFAEIGRMISRTAFSQLRHSSLILAGTLIGLALTYLVPVASIFSGQRWIAALGLITWLLMAACYIPMLRFYGRSICWSAALPCVVSFYAGATFWSAVNYWRGNGGIWKGRVQDSRPSQAE